MVIFISANVTHCNVGLLAESSIHAKETDYEINMDLVDLWRLWY